MTKLADKLNQRSEKEITEDYQATLPVLGTQFYRAIVPWLETLNLLNRLFYLNYEMAEIEKAKDAKKEESK